MTSCNLGDASGAKKYEWVIRKLTVDQSLGRGNDSWSRSISDITVDAGLQAASDCGSTVARLRYARLRRTSSYMIHYMTTQG